METVVEDEAPHAVFKTERVAVLSMNVRVEGGVCQPYHS